MLRCFDSVIWSGYVYQKNNRGQTINNYTKPGFLKEVKKKMNIKLLLATAILFVPVLTLSSAHAALVLVDDFDNNSIDPAWNVSLTGAAISWTGGESGTRLSTSDIDNGTSTDSWGYVNFSQNLGALSDFNIAYNFGRDGDQIVALANNYISLFDSSGSRILLAGTNDAWTNASAQRVVFLQDLNVGSQISCTTGFNTSLASVDLGLSVSRVAGNIDVTWGQFNAGCSLSGYNNTAIARVDISFGAFGQSSFGTNGIEYADYISVEATSPVPVPAAVWLFGSGLIGLTALARRGISEN